VELRDLEERVPSGVPKEEFNRMIFKNNLPGGSVLKFRQYSWQPRLLVDVRRGAGMFDDPCILVSFMQLSLTLACIKALSNTPPNIDGS